MFYYFNLPPTAAIVLYIETEYPNWSLVVLSPESFAISYHLLPLFLKINADPVVES